MAHEISEDVILNLGPQQELVGMEILNASKVLKINPKKPMIELENFYTCAAKTIGA